MLWSPTIFNCGRLLPFFASLAIRAVVPWMTPCWINSSDPSQGGAKNAAAALASTTAFVTTKRRESFLSHMVPSVTDAQKRKLLSDPIFDQKDLFAPASIEAAREAARDVSLYRGAQSRPSMSSGSTQRRPFSSSSSSRGRPHSSPLSTPQRSPASSSSRRLQPKKKTSNPLKNRGGFRR